MSIESLLYDNQTISEPICSKKKSSQNQRRLSEQLIMRRQSMEEKLAEVISVESSLKQENRKMSNIIAEAEEALEQLRERRLSDEDEIQNSSMLL